ncbi:MAG: gliding motility-associated C-terminal domain-containing protein [Saprospiraceae bacterium]|nr:gliding motility-associated C-terminal domain-containing protein [Saprospiraceae bacterium]
MALINYESATIMNFKKATQTILLLILPYWLFGAHIIGGEITYTCQGGGDYDFVFNMYRDCSNPNAGFFDQEAIIGVYRGIGDDAELVDVFTTELLDVDNLLPTQSDPCAIPPPGFCTQVGTYNFSYTIDDWPSDEPYTFVYQRCCRNNTISNIVSPEDTGISFSTEISSASQDVCNSSPFFEGLPPTIICANQNIDEFVTALDNDGDQLVYEFCAPFAGGGDTPNNGCFGIIPNPPCPPPFDEVLFIAPYTLSQPMLGDPVVEIEASSGFISGAPNFLGQFVIGICVKEFRNGVLLGVTRRDIQFNVVLCEPAVVAEVIGGTLVNGISEYDLCLDEEEIMFDFFGSIDTDQNEIGWFLDGPEEFVSQDESPLFQVNLPGNYEGYFYVKDENDCTDTAFIQLDVFNNPIADFSYLYDSCVAGPVFFDNASTLGDAPLSEIIWNLSDETIDDQESPSYFYTTPGSKDVRLVLVDENGCTDSLQGNILYQPAPAVIVVRPSVKEFCPPAEIEIDNLSFPVDSTYEVIWDFGDGNIDTGIVVQNIFEEVGLYDISVNITSPIGCKVDSVFEGLINIQEPPVADFEIIGSDFSNINNILVLENQATNYIGYQWYLDGVWLPSQDILEYELTDTGYTEILMAVRHPLGCVDTIVRSIDVKPENRVFFPNAFTPNGDSKHDEFLPKGVYLGLRDYKLEIYDRYGGLVFSTTDIREGWNGSYQNNGNDVPIGVYQYFVHYTEPRGKKQNLQGSITIIR